MWVVTACDGKIASILLLAFKTIWAQSGRFRFSPKWTKRSNGKDCVINFFAYGNKYLYKFAKEKTQPVLLHRVIGKYDYAA